MHCKDEMLLNKAKRPCREIPDSSGNPLRGKTIQASSRDSHAAKQSSLAIIVEDRSLPLLRPSDEYREIQEPFSDTFE
jgi:hypothetical protein